MLQGSASKFCHVSLLSRIILCKFLMKMLSVGYYSIIDEVEQFIEQKIILGAMQSKNN